MSDLHALLALLTTGVHDLEAVYNASGTPFPSLDVADALPPAPFAEAAEAEAQQAITLVVAAAAQLIALVRSPVASVLDIAFGMYQSASLGVAEGLHISEILRAAGPAGLHVREIGRLAGTEPDKLGRYLRYLASQHVFREVAPDVFANNRLSAILDTGKSIDEIHADPDAKYDGPRGGLAAMVGHSTEECLRGAAFMPAQLVSASEAFSQELHAAPFSHAYSYSNVEGKGERVPFWEWIERPGNERFLRRFGAVMSGTKMMFPKNVILSGYDWKALKKGEVVVDVGGGVGSTTLVLARAFPELRFVVQDRPMVVQEGIKFFEAEYPEALSSGQVSFQAQDFFAAQPAGAGTSTSAPAPAVFLLRAITHDWPNTYVRTILRHLRAAAAPTTRLVITDFVVPYAARFDAPDEDPHAAIPGATAPQAPAPLLPNFGAAASVYNVDMQMLNLYNAQERTVGQFLDVFAGTGWKLEKIHRSAHPQLELSPV